MMWLSIWMQDGTQGGETVAADSITEAEQVLRDEYGDMFGGIADYGFYMEDET